VGLGAREEQRQEPSDQLAQGFETHRPSRATTDLDLIASQAGLNAGSQAGRPNGQGCFPSGRIACWKCLTCNQRDGSGPMGTSVTGPPWILPAVSIPTNVHTSSDCGLLCSSRCHCSGHRP